MQKTLLMIYAVLLSTTIAYGSSFQGMGMPPGYYEAYPAGVSSSCTVVGGDGGMNWIWSNGSYSSRNDVPASFADIANNGSMLGTMNNNFYIVTQNTSTTIPGFSATDQIRANRISGDGTKIVGGSRGGIGWQYSSGNYSYMQLPAGYIYGDARAVSYDGSVVVGLISGTASRNVAFWRESGLEILPNAPGSTHALPYQISGDGSTIVGINYTGDAVRNPAVWRSGSVTILPSLNNAATSMATAVSYDGSIVFGNSFDAKTFDGTGAFIWNELKGMRLLQDALQNEYGLNLSGWTLLGVSATDSSGNVITGYGINPQGQSELWIATIPEPGTMMMLALGAVAMRRRVSA